MVCVNNEHLSTFSLPRIRQKIVLKSRVDITCYDVIEIL